MHLDSGLELQARPAPPAPPRRSPPAARRTGPAAVITVSLLVFALGAGWLAFQARWPAQPALPPLPRMAVAAPGHQPAPGTWVVSQHVVADHGFPLDPAPTRTWTIGRTCAGGCRFELVRYAHGRPTDVTPLEATPLGWVADVRRWVPCGLTRKRWMKIHLLLRFAPDGRSVAVAESARTAALGFGHGTATVTWVGQRT